jgi:predicted DNA-binding protein
LKPRNFAERKIPQSFGLEADQIQKLQQLSKQTGRSVSELARNAFDYFLQQLKGTESINEALENLIPEARKNVNHDHSRGEVQEV